MKFKEMNLPNKLTTIRMFCVPLMLILFVLYGLNKYTQLNCDLILFKNFTLLQLIMMIIFVFASITDYIDGHLARKRNIVSDYGKLMDPLADKLLVNSTIICMISFEFFLQQKESWLYFEIPIMILCVLVIARDFFVDALRMQALKSNAIIPASYIGKLKTATLMPGLVVMFISGLCLPLYVIGIVLVTLGCIFGIISGIKYFIDLKKYIKE